jgi:AcrR family transcriptional regulator
VSPRPRFATLDPAKSAAILRSAAEELAENGVERASYNRIIERAGVSKGAMYYYFDDRWDLYLTVVRDAAERGADAIGELAPCDDALSYWDALLDLYQRVTGFFVAEPTAAALLKTVLTQPPGSGVANLLAEYTAGLERAFGAILERGAAVGAVRVDVPIELLTRIAFAIGEAMDRWTLVRWETLTPQELGDLPRAMLAMHMRALAPLPLVSEWEHRSGASPLPERTA